MQRLQVSILGSQCILWKIQFSSLLHIRFGFGANICNKLFSVLIWGKTANWQYKIKENYESTQCGMCVCVVFTKMCVAMQTRQRVCLRMRLCEWVSKWVSVCVRENGRHYVSDAVKWTDEKCSCRKICLPTKWHRWTFIS